MGYTTFSDKPIYYSALLQYIYSELHDFMVRKKKLGFPIDFPIDSPSSFCVHELRDVAIQLTPNGRGLLRTAPIHRLEVLTLGRGCYRQHLFLKQLKIGSFFTPFKKGIASSLKKTRSWESPSYMQVLMEKSKNSLPCVIPHWVSMEV